MEDDWILYSVTLFTFGVIFAFCYIRHVFTFFERNKIPGTTYATFPFGNVYDVIFQRTPMFMQLWKFYNKSKRKKYSVSGFYVFLKPVVLIMNPSEIFLATNNDYFVKDAKYDNLIPEIHRNLCKPSTNLPKVWCKLFSQFQKEEQDVNFTSLMNDQFIDTVAQLFGLKVAQRRGVIFHFLERNNIFSICKTLIFLCYPVFNHFSTENEFEKRYMILENVKQSKKKDDFLHILIQNGVSNEEITKYICLMLYNLKRSNNLVLFTLYELCIDKEIQEELRDEIIRFRKNRPDINYDHLDELGYLETVVCETLRKYPLEPFFYKICKKDFSSKNIAFTKGLLVFVSTFGIHHDAQNYVNPELFDPDRFSEENRKFIAPTKYLPFGCQNENEFDAQYVKTTMKLALIELLTIYRFSLCQKSPKAIQFDATLFKSLKFKEDVWLKIHKM